VPEESCGRAIACNAPKSRQSPQLCRALLLCPQQETYFPKAAGPAGGDLPLPGPTPAASSVISPDPEALMFFLSCTLNTQSTLHRTHCL